MHPHRSVSQDGNDFADDMLQLLRGASGQLTLPQSTVCLQIVLKYAAPDALVTKSALLLQEYCAIPPQTLTPQPSLGKSSSTTLIDMKDF